MKLSKLLKKRPECGGYTPISMDDPFAFIDKALPHKNEAKAEMECFVYDGLGGKRPYGRVPSRTCKQF